MAKDNIIPSLRETVYDMMDKNGNFRVVPIGVTGDRDLDEERLQLLRDILVLFRDSDMLDRATKMYIFQRDITIKSVAMDINEERKKEGLPELKVSSVQSKIYFGKEKIKKYYGELFLSDIKFTRKSIEDYIKITRELSEKYFGNYKLRKGLAISLREQKRVVESLEEDKFRDFVQMIAPYTKNQMNYIETNISDEQIGYFNYLLGKNDRNERDQGRFELLKGMLE